MTEDKKMFTGEHWARSKCCSIEGVIITLMGPSMTDHNGHIKKWHYEALNIDLMHVVDYFSLALKHDFLMEAIIC